MDDPSSRQFVPATVPPNFAASAEVQADIDTFNAGLRASYPHVVEFHDGFTREMFESDGIHVNDAGNALRAERAIAAIRAL